MMIQLKKEKRFEKSMIQWTAAKPFIENTKAVLIHRPRHVTTHRILGKSHLAIKCWCGNSFSGTKKFTFLDAPPDSKIVCARCEDAAVGAGMLSSEQLVGSHVHTGGVVAVLRCCNHGLLGDQP